MRDCASFYVSGRLVRKSQKCTMKYKFLSSELRTSIAHRRVLCSQAFNMADKLADVQIVLASTFLLS